MPREFDCLVRNAPRDNPLIPTIKVWFEDTRQPLSSICHTDNDNIMTIFEYVMLIDAGNNKNGGNVFRWVAGV
jgi:hypothetical protein